VPSPSTARGRGLECKNKMDQSSRNSNRNRRSRSGAAPSSFSKWMASVDMDSQVASILGVSKPQTWKRQHSKMACTECKRSKTKCNNERPCDRCVRMGNEDKCVDIEMGYMCVYHRLSSPLNPFPYYMTCMCVCVCVRARTRTRARVHVRGLCVRVLCAKVCWSQAAICV